MISCALWFVAFGQPSLVMSQAAKVPAMGSAGMTGGSVPANPAGGGAPTEVDNPVGVETPDAPTEAQDPQSVEPRKDVKGPASTAAPRSPRETSTVPSVTIPQSDIGIPPFHLARLTLAGEVSGDRAVITAQIDVDVNRDQSEYHDVPLRFTQAHVLSKEYDGPGMEGPVVVGFAVRLGLISQIIGHRGAV